MSLPVSLHFLVRFVGGVRVLRLRAREVSLKVSVLSVENLPDSVSISSGLVSLGCLGDSVTERSHLEVVLELTPGLPKLLVRLDMAVHVLSGGALLGVVTMASANLASALAEKLLEE